MTVDFGDRKKPEVVETKDVVVTHDREMISRFADDARSRGGRIILDIGCGDKLSVNAAEGALIIGVEPRMGKRSRGIEVTDDSQAVFFDEKADALPENLNPDLALYVAPDPGEIGSILYELDRVKGPNTRVIIAFDNTSYEATHGGLQRGLREALSSLHEMGMETKILKGGVDSFGGILKKQKISSGGNLNSSHIFGGRITYLLAKPN